MSRSEALGLKLWTGLSLSVGLALGAAPALGAACCGGSSAAPALISGDDAYQLTAGISRGVVIGDAPVSGLPVFRSPGHDEVTQTLRLDGAMLLSDRWQASFTAPVVQRSLDLAGLEGSTTRLGDVSLGLGYEALPEWGYSEWRPRGFVFAQLQLPTAPSIYDAQAWGATDAVGSGFLRLAVGGLFLKTRGAWDYSLMPELHRALARSFVGTDGSVFEVIPGWGASLALGAGYNLPVTPLRVGLRVAPVWNAGRTVDSGQGGLGQSSDQWVWNAGLDVSWLAGTDWSVTGSYTDQTLLGPAVNTTLSRTLALSVQRRWPR